MQDYVGSSSFSEDVDGANVSMYNNTGAYFGYNLSNASGHTPWINLTWFVRNKTHRFEYTNYTFSATKAGYNVTNGTFNFSSEHTENLTLYRQVGLVGVSPFLLHTFSSPEPKKFLYWQLYLTTGLFVALMIIARAGLL